MRRDPALALLLLACALALALYAPTLSYGLVNQDDPWLIRDNWIAQHASLSSLHHIFFDLGRDTRVVLGAEYLPVRDLSVMFDASLWGDTYAGHHAMNVLFYVLAILVWFRAFVALGIDRTTAAVALLLWAVHPTHAESVAWLSERKGLLAALLSGVTVLSYARFRSGAHWRWIAIGALTAICGVWSKGVAAFAIAALGGLELVLPAGRISWRRSLTGLAIVGAATALAFVPVLVVASRMSVISDAGASGGALGTYGFYLRLAAMTMPNAITYPINADGVTTLDLVMGSVGLVAAAAALLPRSPVRAAGVLWLFTYFPVSRLVLPVRLVVAADRYLLLPSLAIALAVATGIDAVQRRSRRSVAVALTAAIVVAGVARTLDAQRSWRNARALWARAVLSNPHDANAWSMDADAMADSGDTDGAMRTVDVGLKAVHTNPSRLHLRKAILSTRIGRHDDALTWMRRAADEGEPIAMTNLALMLADDDPGHAIEWARKAVNASPLYANGFRILGKLSLARQRPDEALVAFTHALTLEPTPTNRYNLALALAALGRTAEARAELERCAHDPALAARAQLELSRLPR